ncbi:MAG: sialidase family protein [Chloroflexota bacterium]|nr:sialidase family protein [Chloroflexota bacterium]
MNRSFAAALAIMAMTVLFTSVPGSVMADENDARFNEEVDKPNVEIPEVASPFINSVAGVANPAPFTYLTPISDLLSSSVGLMARGFDPRTDQGITNHSKRSNAPPPGLAWEALPEVFMAPTTPPNAPAVQGAGLVPFRDPAPAFSRNILIPRDFSNAPLQTEPSIAVNPNDPDHLVMGSIDYNFPNVTNYVSIDGGVTWEGPFRPPYLAEDIGSGGDAVVAFDRDGNVYIIFISIGVEEFTVGPAADQAVVSSIAISKSENGGRTWNEPVSSFRSGISKNLSPGPDGQLQGDIAISFLDKPWLGIGPSKEDLSTDAIYVTMTEFTERFPIIFPFGGNFPFFGVPVLETAIKVVSSTDGGQTWSESTTASPVVRRVFASGGSSEEDIDGEVDSKKLQAAPSNAIGTQRVLQGSQPAVGLDGSVYVTWLDSTDDDSMEGLAENYIARSDDGGKTFGVPVRTSVFNEPGFLPRNGFFRYWGSAFPQIAVGPNDEVYVVYTAKPPDDPTDDGDIYFVRSSDRGETWSRPFTLNGDDTDHLQFFPSIATSPNGNIHVMWGDFRDDRAQTRYQIYYTTSDDEGVTWGFQDTTLGIDTRDTRVSDYHSNANKGFPGGQFIGDYFSIDASDQDAYLTWADTRLGEYGPVNQKIGFTRRAPIPSPEVFLNPPAGPGGQPVTLQGFNFQPDINVLIRVSGVAVATERTNELGRFTSQVFIPISGEGAHAVGVFDDSGNAATSSFFMEFGFDNVQGTQKLLAERIENLEARIGNISGDLSDVLQAQIDALKVGLVAPEMPDIPAPIIEDTQAPWWLLITGIAGTAAIVASLTYFIARPKLPDRWVNVK